MKEFPRGKRRETREEEVRGGRGRGGNRRKERAENGRKEARGGVGRVERRGGGK